MVVLLAAGATALPHVASVFLAREYEENEVAADARYTGKTLEVEGPMRSVQRIDGVVYVNLHSGDLLSVRGELVTAETRKAAALRWNDLVTLRCRCMGVGMLGGVHLDRCRIVSVEHRE